MTACWHVAVGLVFLLVAWVAVMAALVAEAHGRGVL